MSDSVAGTAEAVVAIVELTRAEALALVAAHKALEVIELRARSCSYTYRAEQKRVRAGAIVAERSDVAQDAIASLLIALEVHGDEVRAKKALARL